jgi:hypothetical protein
MGLLVFVGTHAEVFASLAGIPLAAEKYSIGTSWRTKSELIEGKGLATSLQDAFLGTFREAKGGNRQLGNFEQTDIICNGANLDHNF